MWVFAVAVQRVFPCATLLAAEVGMREQIFDRSAGAGRIRWTDQPSDVQREYPDAMFMGGMQGRNPLTGEAIPIPRGVMIPEFGRIGGVGTGAFAAFVGNTLTAIEVLAVVQGSTRLEPAARALLERFDFAMPVDFQLPPGEPTKFLPIDDRAELRLYRDESNGALQARLVMQRPDGK